MEEDGKIGPELGDIREANCGKKNGKPEQVKPNEEEEEIMNFIFQIF